MQLFNRGRENSKLIDREFLRIIDVVSNVFKVKNTGISILIFDSKIVVVFKKKKYKMTYNGGGRYSMLVDGLEVKTSDNYEELFIEMYSEVCRDFLISKHLDFIKLKIKKCSVCNIKLDINEFSNRYNSKDGKRNSCKNCSGRKKNT